MKRNKLLSLALLGLLAAPVIAAPNVGVSININQPGVYGRVDIGGYPQPPVLVYPQPVIITQPPVVVERRPIYLYVPPAHQQNWGRYCGRYSACGQPVYFVQERWVRERWEHEHRGYDGDRGRHLGHDKHDKRDKWEKHDKHDKSGKHDKHDKQDKHGRGRD